MDDISAKLAKIAESLDRIAEALEGMNEEGVMVFVHEIPLLRVARDESAEAELRRLRF
jgi:hypothetical protein